MSAVCPWTRGSQEPTHPLTGCPRRYYEIVASRAEDFCINHTLVSWWATGFPNPLLPPTLSSRAIPQSYLQSICPSILLPKIFHPLKMIRVSNCPLVRCLAPIHDGGVPYSDSASIWVAGGNSLKMLWGGRRMLSLFGCALGSGLIASLCPRAVGTAASTVPVRCRRGRSC